MYRHTHRHKKTWEGKVGQWCWRKECLGKSWHQQHRQGLVYKGNLAGRVGHPGGKAGKQGHKINKPTKFKGWGETGGGGKARKKVGNLGAGMAKVRQAGEGRQAVPRHGGHGTVPRQV